jgi:hypothetical protein
VRLSEIVYRNNEITDKGCARAKLGLRSASFGNNLSKLGKSFTKGRLVRPFQNRKRVFLSKSRYMSGRQCSKKLWQTVYDPEPVEEPLPGTIKGMGIEVGIKARLLWPGGVLIDTKHDDYAEALRRTDALIADPTVPTIFEAALVHDGLLIRVDAVEAGRVRHLVPTQPGQTVSVRLRGSEGAPFRRPREVARLPPMAGSVRGTTWADRIAAAAKAAQIASHLLVQPDVLKARAVVDTVDHLGHPLHPWLVADRRGWKRTGRTSSSISFLSISHTNSRRFSGSVSIDCRSISASTSWLQYPP